MCLEVHKRTRLGAALTLRAVPSSHFQTRLDNPYFRVQTMANDSPSQPTATAATQPSLHLLDLSTALLIELLSAQHSSSSTARSAATICKDLRHAMLASVTLCHADLDTAVAAQVIRFARTLPLLQCLRLTGMDAALEPSELRALAALTCLHELELTGEHINRAADVDYRLLARLTNLRTLTLDSCSADASCVRSVPTLPHLHTVNLARNAAITSLRILAAATGLRSLNLQVVALDSQGVHLLGRLASSLTYLNLSKIHITNTPVADAGARAVARLTGLCCLALQDCSIGAGGAVALSALTALTQLDLSLYEVVADGAAAVGALTNLSSLAMTGYGTTDL